LPDGATFAGATSDTLTLHGSQVVATLGRLGIGGDQTLQVSAKLSASLTSRTLPKARAVLRSSTALPVISNEGPTLIGQH
jgi:hypothetical protein